MDPKKSLWQKFQTQENHSDLPVIKICDWGPWVLNNLSGIHYAGTLTLTLTLTQTPIPNPSPNPPPPPNPNPNPRLSSNTYVWDVPPQPNRKLLFLFFEKSKCKESVIKNIFYDLKGKATNFKPKVHCNCFVRLHQRKWYVRSPLHGNLL